jgi:YfiH family protein
MEALFFDFPESGAPARGGSEGVRAFLSLAASGDMKYEYGKENRQRDAFLSSIGMGERRFVGLELAHSQKAVYADRRADSGLGKADGLLSDDIGLCLGVTVSDCMPIWLLDRSSGAFGVLHSGWKGTGIALEALKTLGESRGTKAGDVAFILGPCIGACCYQVPPERAVQFMDAFGDNAAHCRDGEWYIDMKKANEKILMDAGVHDILTIDICTSCDPRMGSFRRQGKAAFVRMLAGIGASFPLDRG